MEALDNAWSGSWWSLTNLKYKFSSVSFVHFNVAAIFFRVIPTYGILPYAVLFLLGLGLTVIEINIKKQDLKNIKNVGMACQKACKQGRDDIRRLQMRL